MTASIIYYSDVLTPWKESLKSYLDSSSYRVEWSHVTSLSECPVDNYLLIGEQDLKASDLPLLASRRCLVLVEHWQFSSSAHWISKGAKNASQLNDVERIAAWVLAVLAHRDSVRVSKQEASSMLQSVIDAIPVPIFYKDEYHIYRGCNQAFSQFSGLPVDQIVNRSVYDIAKKELADIYYQADCELLAKGGTQVYEGPMCNAQGERFEVEFNKAVFYKEDGQKGGQVGAMLNITERNRLMRELEKASRTDPLTKTGNRREFDCIVREEIRKGQQDGTPLSLLIIDIDHFKLINDEFGHAGGDDALIFVVERLKEQLPQQASMFRIGGEEFYILLSQTDLSAAHQIAEHLRQDLATQPLRLLETDIQMTISLGVIQLSDEDNLETSLKQVDKALYQAKKTGRNKVCIASSGDSQFCC